MNINWSLHPNSTFAALVAAAEPPEDTGPKVKKNDVED